MRKSHTRGFIPDYGFLKVTILSYKLKKKLSLNSTKILPGREIGLPVL